MSLKQPISPDRTSAGKMFSLAAAACVAWITSIASALPVVSDNFNRPDNATALGATDQGYTWQFINIGGLHDWTPGIKNGRMWWQAADWNQNNPVTLVDSATMLKNFVLDLDLILTPGANRAVTTYFRTQKWQTVDTTGVAGYGLSVRQVSSTYVTMTLYNSTYGISKTLTTNVGGIGCHLTIRAVDNNIKIFINNAATPVIDFTDTTANPAKNVSGYFAFWGGNALDAQGFDNLTINRLPTTSSIADALVSDAFSRPDAPRELGRTDQGYVWSRLGWGDPSATYNPGIKNDLLWFQPGGWNKNDAVTLSSVPPLKNFTLKFDYVTLETAGAARALGIYIRSLLNRLPNEESNIAGYAVYVRQVNATTINVLLANTSYGISQSADVTTATAGCHVKVVASGNNIQIYINNAAAPAINFVDTTANPAKDAAGYISFYGGNAMDRQGIDHLIIIPQKGLVCDAFNRPDSSKDLGRTEQGFSWSRITWGDPSASYNPGIKNSRLWYEPGDWNKNDAVTLPEVMPLKNFTMEYDYVTLEENGAARAIGAFFRTPKWQLPNEQPSVAGYGVYIKQVNTNTVNISLLNSSYGISQSVNVPTSSPGSHVKIVAVDANIKVYLNNAAAPAIDFTDTTSNPAKDAFGYIAFYGGNSSDRQGIDNLIIMPDVQDTVFTGWYDHVTWTTLAPDEIAQAGGKIIFLYVAEEPLAKIQTYLDSAVACGIKVVLGFDELVEAFNMDAVTARVNAFKDHPALGGWYIFDEPWDDYKIYHCQTTADIIRAVSSKPIYIDFAAGGLESLPYNYRNTYDIMLFDYYPFSTGDPEFGQKMAGWKTLCDQARDEAARAGKPLYMVIQAIGKVPYWADTFRLPTYREERFMAFYSLLNNADAVIFWSEYARQMSAAIATDVYPYSGDFWREEIAKPLMQEINFTAAALGAGPITSGVSNTNTEIQTRVYQDPTSGQYHVLALNCSDAIVSGTVTLNLPLPIGLATPIHVAAGDDQTSKSLQNRTFFDTLTPYDVHHYLLTVTDDAAILRLDGDANEDGVVDVGDLGILAANYGKTTGVSWSSGDFNGDGVVDVGDLGILAAHYGEGSSTAQDFNADYAKVFNSTLTDDSENEIASSPICSAAGLPLVVALFLVSLTLGKFEEKNKY